MRQTSCTYRSIIVTLIFALLTATPMASPACGGQSICCPADITGDGTVAGDDLSYVLAQWGGPGTADLDGSGTVNDGDLGVLLSLWGECPTECNVTRVVGSVRRASGETVSNAVVVTDQGGASVSGANGSFAFDVNVTPGITSLTVTAVATIDGVNLIGDVIASPIVLDGETDAGIITVEAKEPCTPEWLPTFGGQPGMTSNVNAMTVFDDGNGPALYVGGSFTQACGLAAMRIAKWDGTSWSTVGGGLGGWSVFALCVFDDGSGNGPALIAGGFFDTAGGIPAKNIAKWDGTVWSPLGSGTNVAVHALTSFDDGSGPSLIAGGEFSIAGGVPAKYIARWNGSTWSALGNGTDAAVRALATFDDGTGTALYAGGSFASAGQVPASRIARWNGVEWSSLGSGVDASVYALTVFDDGTGPALIAGGDFTIAGGVRAVRVAKWSGAEWTPLGGGVNPNGFVRALCVFDDGTSGPLLYAGGGFSSAGGVAAKSIAKWTGSSWMPLGEGLDSTVFSIAAFDDGTGPQLYAGGLFKNSSSLPMWYIARWKSNKWGALAPGLNNHIYTLMTFDDGSGPRLFAGGEFTMIGGKIVKFIAKWNGYEWAKLGSGVNGNVASLAVFDDGNGPALYAAGNFVSAGGSPANRIAKWDGTSWSPLGEGVSGSVLSLATFDDGSGTKLYAAGLFLSAGGVPAAYIAAWDGKSWLTVPGFNNHVYSLETFNDGSSTALYAAGKFTTAGGVAAKRIAKWDGVTWSPVGSGMNLAVYDLAAYDDGSGSGSALYAAGDFTTAGVPANRIAKWNGNAWQALGSGVDATVYSLCAFDDGQGPALYVGGDLSTAGGIASNRIARWNGATWSEVGEGVIGGPVKALITFGLASDRPSSLYVGGHFTASPGGDSFCARWGCAP